MSVIWSDLACHSLLVCC
uniref:Uncharacterized protein n=1 Tax=Anguilla anguilla TaxID=7936 RepID=A0A0E9QVR1_ANGAN